MESIDRKRIIAVMGPGEGASTAENAAAYELGKLIASAGWILLSGGRNSGVMDAASKGAKTNGGLTIGILPTTDRQKVSEAIDIPILTDMGEARNNINVLTSDIIIACGMGPGTASEVALALKAQKIIILLNCPTLAQAFFESMAARYVLTARTPQEAIELVREYLAGEKEDPGIQHFIDDDQGFQQWMTAHPQGYILNCHREPKATYLVLHTAQCWTLNQLPEGGSSWTTMYRKVCSMDRAALIQWANHIGGQPKLCEHCNS
jgi:uncharacterized protein (TIGR00725 family)